LYNSGPSLTYPSTLLRTKHIEIEFNEMQISGPVFYNLAFEFEGKTITAKFLSRYVSSI